MQIASPTDEYPGTPAFVTCTFTVDGYAPAAGQALVDTVRVEAHEPGNVGNAATDADDSTVTTAVRSAAPTESVTSPYVAGSTFAGARSRWLTPLSR